LGLNDLHRLQSLFPVLSVGFVGIEELATTPNPATAAAATPEAVREGWLSFLLSSGEDCILLDTGFCKLKLSSDTDIGSGTGSASGGTAPGSVVIALKWAHTARKAIVAKNEQCIYPK